MITAHWAPTRSVSKFDVLCKFYDRGLKAAVVFFFHQRESLIVASVGDRRSSDPRSTQSDEAYKHKQQHLFETRALDIVLGEKLHGHLWQYFDESASIK